jgi:hypothetical protein
MKHSYYNFFNKIVQIPFIMEKKNLGIEKIINLSEKNLEIIGLKEDIFYDN